MNPKVHPLEYYKLIADAEKEYRRMVLGMVTIFAIVAVLITTILLSLISWGLHVFLPAQAEQVIPIVKLIGYVVYSIAILSFIYLNFRSNVASYAKGLIKLNHIFQVVELKNEDGESNEFAEDRLLALRGQTYKDMSRPDKHLLGRALALKLIRANEAFSMETIAEVGRSNTVDGVFEAFNNNEQAVEFNADDIPGRIARINANGESVSLTGNK